MRPTPRLHLLFALIFAIGQWFAVVHGTQHELSAGDKAVACEICALGHASAAGPVLAASAPAFAARTESPAVPVIAAPRAAVCPHPPSRGPPTYLV